MAATLARAGFWRRAIAISLDALIAGVVATVVLAIPVGLLFSLDNGMVQFGSTSLVSGSARDEASGRSYEFGFPGISVTTCEKVALDRLPQGLDPPTGKLASAVECRAAALGLVTSARTLRLVAVREENGEEVSYDSTHTLGADGQPRSAWALDDLVYLVLLAYLVVFQWRNGASLGMDALRIRVVDLSDPERHDLPLRRAMIRVVGQFGGVLAAVFLLGRWDFAPSFAPWLPAVVAILVLLCYPAWIAVDIARKRDPIYDRIAGTAVVRADG